MKSDSELKRDVSAELAWDPAINSDAIGVSARDGVVTLTGHIDTFAQKHAAERAAQRVAGVQALALELDVRLAPDHKRNDTEIARNAELALKWNTAVDPGKIRIKVDNGWVTLDGDVDWDFQRRGVEKVIRPLIGVVGISNKLKITERPRAADLSRKIEEALTRQAVREARRIEVHAEGSTVILKGRVHSLAERAAVEGVAWASPGVHSVINAVTVGGLAPP